MKTEKLKNNPLIEMPIGEFKGKFIKQMDGQRELSYLRWFLNTEMYVRSTPEVKAAIKFRLGIYN